MAKQELGPLQKKWIEWLRANPDKQTTGQLRRGNSFCCLGVAEKICGRTPGTKKGEASHWGTLSDEVQYKMQFHDVSGEFVSKKGKLIFHKLKGVAIGDLAAFNDEGGTFAQIADYVEKYPHRVFKGPA